MGRLLALRGWALGDTLGGVNGDLALPGRPDRTDIFNERDQRPALYSWLTVGDEQELATLKVGYMDNRGDQSHSGVWHTHFSTVGLVLHPLPQIDMIAQYLDGVARVHAPPNSSSLSALYILVSPHYKRQRLTVRYDVFRVHDLDGLRHRLALEYVWMTNHRVANAPLNPTPDGWQVSYRFRY